MSFVIKRITPQIEDRIESFIAVGEITLDESEDSTTMIECARRYVETEFRRRARTSVRSTEHVAVARIKANERYVQRAAEVVRDIVHTINPGWNAELLESSFSLGDGTTVMWGEATAREHDVYAAMLEGQAAGSLETAALHRAAIRDIQALGVSNLSQVIA